MIQSHPGLAPDVAALSPFVAADLNAVDDMAAEAVAVFCFSDVRPLAGAAEILDWRLSGRLSRALERGLVSGALGEVTLLPVMARRRRRVFLFGLGEVRATDRAVFRKVGREAMVTLTEAGALGVALVAPAARDELEVEAEFLRAVAEELKGQVLTVLVAPRPA